MSEHLEKTTKFSIKIRLKRTLIRQLKRTINQCKSSCIIIIIKKNIYIYIYFCKNILLYTIISIAMVLKIIISKCSFILKMMFRNTFPEPQPDSASYVYRRVSFSAVDIIISKEEEIFGQKILMMETTISFFV